MTNEEIEKEVQLWLERNTSCPPEVKEWLLRTTTTIDKPYVNPQDKLRYIRAHDFLENEIKSITGGQIPDKDGKVKVRVTQAKDLNDAMRIMLEENPYKQ